MPFLTPFFGEGSPAKINYRKKGWYPYSNLSNLEDLEYHVDPLKKGWVFTMGKPTPVAFIAFSVSLFDLWSKQIPGPQRPSDEQVPKFFLGFGFPSLCPAPVPFRLRCFFETPPTTRGPSLLFPQPTLGLKGLGKSPAVGSLRSLDRFRRTPSSHFFP